MKIAFIGTYPPRQCGIGTFTNNLFNSILGNNEGHENKHEGFVIAINDHDQIYEYPEEVKLTIRQEHQEDYLEAAKFINLSGTDLCILEHEYGIFGGQNGIYILPLLNRLEVPFIATLHTILKNPNYIEKAILKEICKMAQKIVVMSHRAIEFLVTIYAVPEMKIQLIEHGVPDIQFNHEKSKRELNLESRIVLLTFGFIGRSKGIETVIKALPNIIKKYPKTIYVVLGKTHPNVLRYSGEEYRNFLYRLIKSLNLENNVLFLNEFINQKELFKYLFASDIYITPYLNEAQITSGTLSYAVGVGTAVISTPYWHAQELLANGRGRIFDFQDSEGLSNIIIELLDNPEMLKTMREKAYTFGRKITWPKTGEKYVLLSEKICNENPEILVKKVTNINPQVLPPFSLEHILRLTDDTGIIQHAKFGIPNLKEGYCLDDNARALILVLMAYMQKKDMQALNLMPIYLSYIDYMQNDDGTFRNFMSFNRSFVDEVVSEDSFGRAIWALGYLLKNAPKEAYYQSGRLIFFNAAPNFENLKSIRSIAYTMIGICYYLWSNPSDDSMSERLRNMAKNLIRHYNENKSADWKWYEPLFTYDNGILPLALLHSAEILNDDEISKVAMETMDFLTQLTLKENYLSIIGNENWYKKNEERSVFAQQPVDALAMVLMFQQAYYLTGNKEYLDKLFTSFLWFLGENDLRISLYDFETKGCCDGFESYGINRNQGAESSLAYLISHLTVLQVFDDIHKVD